MYGTCRVPFELERFEGSVRPHAAILEVVDRHRLEEVVWEMVRWEI